MKIELEILPDQLELLDKIKSLKKVIVDHLGDIPQSFPISIQTLNEYIDDMCIELETEWNRWVLSTLESKLNSTNLFKGCKIVHNNYCGFGD